MDRQKLLGIIVKDLEELKFLSEEITENEEKSNLIIDLALSKAKLLCQEIEVLKEISAPAISQPEKEADDAPEETSDEEEESISVAEPELEIINFEHPDLKEEEETEEEEEEDEETDDDLTAEEEEEESIESEIEEPVFEVAGEEETEKPEEEEEEEEEEGPYEEDELDDLDEEENDLEEDAEEEPEMKAEETPLKEESKPEFREIALDDDDDIETIPVAPSASAQKAPVFREIPKPEEPVAEKAIVADAFQKERSLNDAIGENQATESKIATGPINNLRAAIGLNDRFLFIREIFDNNAEKYNNIIENLDKMETIQQAVEYLKANLTLQKNETSMKFVELLKRRFTK